MRILYAGQMGESELCRARAEALRRVGAEIEPFDFSPYYDWIARSVVRRALRKYARWTVVRGMNRDLREACRRSAPEVLYVDKAVDFHRDTLVGIRADAAREGRRIKLVHYHPDDAFHPLLNTREYESAVAEWDCLFCPHTWVNDEHLERGAKKVVFLPYAYDPNCHYREYRPGQADADTADVVFVGRWEETRGAWIENLAAHGIRVDVWGPHWPTRLQRDATLRYRGGFADFAAQRRAYGTAKISLGLMSFTNRDGHTSRTFEIPACGGFMLGERTTGQRAMFTEDVEMACFEGGEEMLEKTRYYLENEAEREAIREAGYRRSIESGYDTDSRARQVLEELRGLD